MAWMTSALLLHACFITMLFIISFTFEQRRMSGELMLKCLVWETVLEEIQFSLVHLENMEQE